MFDKEIQFAILPTTVTSTGIIASYEIRPSHDHSGFLQPDMQKSLATISMIDKDCIRAIIWVGPAGKLSKPIVLEFSRYDPDDSFDRVLETVLKHLMEYYRTGIMDT